MADKIRCEYCGRVEDEWGAEDLGWAWDEAYDPPPRDDGPCGKVCFQIFDTLYHEDLLDLVGEYFVLPKRAMFRLMQLRCKYGILRRR